MGCGGSKRLEPEGEAIPEKLRPLLRRRYEELRNKSRGVRIAPKSWKTTSTLSKKELLGKDNPSYEEIDVEMDDDRRSESSDEGNMKVTPIAEEGLDEGLVKAKVFELSSPLSTNADEKKVVGENAVVSIPESEGNDETGCASNEQTSEQSEDGNLKACLEPQEGNTEVQVPALACLASSADEAEPEEEILAVPPCLVLEGDDVVEEEEEIKELGQTFGFRPLLFPPGSPSFRLYLNAPSIKRNEDDNNGDDINSSQAAKEVETVKLSPTDKESQIQENEKDTEEQSKGSTESAESLHSDEAKKRWRRGLKFKGKLPRPRTSGMKNLFKVQSCYSSCSCGQGTTLLEEKALTQKQI